MWACVQGVHAAQHHCTCACMSDMQQCHTACCASCSSHGPPAAGGEGEQAEAGAAGSKEATELLAAVVTALLDDLNTPSAVAALSAPLKTINDLLFTKAGKKAKGRLDTLAGIQQGIQQVSARLAGYQASCTWVQWLQMHWSAHTPAAHTWHSALAAAVNDTMMQHCQCQLPPVPWQHGPAAVPSCALSAMRRAEAGRLLQAHGQLAYTCHNRIVVAMHAAQHRGHVSLTAPCPLANAGAHAARHACGRCGGHAAAAA
jgi:hypothetical protein